MGAEVPAASPRRRILPTWASAAIPTPTHNDGENFGFENEDEEVIDVNDHYGPCQGQGCVRTAFFESGGYRCASVPAHVFCGQCMHEYMSAQYHKCATTRCVTCPAIDENMACQSGGCGTPLSWFDVCRIAQLHPNNSVKEPLLRVMREEIRSAISTIN